MPVRCHCQKLSTGNRLHVPDSNRVQHSRWRSTGEHWIAMYVDTKRHGDYFDPYGLEPQHIEFTNFMNENCSEWVPNDRTLQSPLSTVCGQYVTAHVKLSHLSVEIYSHFITYSNRAHPGQNNDTTMQATFTLFPEI